MNETEKPFSGDFKDGKFSLELNLFEKYSPVKKFSCTVSGDDKKCSIKVVFHNTLFEIKSILFFVLVNIAIGVFLKLWIIVPINLGLNIMLGTISFNVKINKCMEEIEYIMHKTVLGIDE